MTTAGPPSGSMLLSSKLRRNLLDTSLTAMDRSGGDASSNLMSHTLALVERLQVRSRSSLRLHVQTHTPSLHCNDDSYNNNNNNTRLNPWSKAFNCNLMRTFSHRSGVHFARINRPLFIVNPFFCFPFHSFSLVKVCSF